MFTTSFGVLNRQTQENGLNCRQVCFDGFGLLLRCFLLVCVWVSMINVENGELYCLLGVWFFVYACSTIKMNGNLVGRNCSKLHSCFWVFLDCLKSLIRMLLVNFDVWTVVGLLIPTIDIMKLCRKLCEIAESLRHLFLFLLLLFLLFALEIELLQRMLLSLHA